ncbi:hypothetical protein ACHWQZ_G001075 [Mnemiopsis leidyi]
MKILFICLVLVTALVTINAKKDKKQKVGPGFKALKAALYGMKSEMDNSLEYMLDENTESGLDGEAEEFLKMIQQSVCFDPEESCTSDKYFGCNCIKEFQNLGAECSQIPCKIVTFLLDDFATFLKDFRDEAVSMEAAIDMVMERIYIPMMDMACECSDRLSEATFTCIKNYDAEVIESIGQSMYQTVIENFLDIDSMKSVMDAVLAMQCNEVGDDVCYEDFANQVTTWGKMMDKSMAGAKRKDCSAYSRIDNQIAKYTSALESGDMSEFFTNYYGLVKKAACDKKCAKNQAEVFYTCCSVEAIDLAEEYKFIENIGNIVSKVRNLMAISPDTGLDADLFNMEDLQTYFSSYDVEEVCSGTKAGKIYSKKRKECEKEIYDF